MVKTLLPLQGDQVQFLVRELRSRMLNCTAEKKKKSLFGTSLVVQWLGLHAANFGGGGGRGGGFQSLVEELDPIGCIYRSHMPQFK